METFLRQKHTIDVTKVPTDFPQAYPCSLCCALCVYIDVVPLCVYTKQALLTRLFELCRERHPDAPPLTGPLPVRVFLTARMLLHDIDRPLLDDRDILPVLSIAASTAHSSRATVG